MFEPSSECKGPDMKSFRRSELLQISLVALSAVCAAQPPVAAQDSAAAASPRTLAPYFAAATSQPKAPDANGFLQRWMLLDRMVQHADFVGMLVACDPHTFRIEAGRPVFSKHLVRLIAEWANCSINF